MPVVRTLKLSLIPVLFLSGTLLSAQTQNVVNHAGEIEAALRLAHQHNDAEAVGMLEHILAVTVRENNSLWEATALAVIGPIYQRLRRFTDAENSLNLSIAKWTTLQGANARALIGPLGSLASLYFDAAQYSRAEKAIARALEIADTTAAPAHTKAVLLTNLGSIYVSEHKDDLARQKGEEALRAFQPSDTSRGWAYSILGAVNMHGRRIPEAEDDMIQAISIWKSQFPADDPMVANGLANLATLYSFSDHPEKAEPLFRQAAAIFDKGENDDAFVLQSLTEYANVEKRLGHKKEAKRLEKQVGAMASVSAVAAMSRQVIDVSSFLER
jgi:tetratricopeptide (TPR) repeat protein